MNQLEPLKNRVAQDVGTELPRLARVREHFGHNTGEHVSCFQAPILALAQLAPSKWLLCKGAPYFPEVVTKLVVVALRREQKAENRKKWALVCMQRLKSRKKVVVHTSLWCLCLVFVAVRSRRQLHHHLLSVLSMNSLPHHRRPPVLGAFAFPLLRNCVDCFHLYKKLPLSSGGSVNC